MSTLGRRPFLRSGIAATIISPLVPATAKQAAMVETTPVYGADTVAGTDPAALSASIERQLSAAGFPRPQLDLFPKAPGVVQRILERLGAASAQLNTLIGSAQSPSATQGVMQAPHGWNRDYSITGLREGPDGSDFAEEFMQDRSKNQVLSVNCQCRVHHSHFEKVFPAYRVFTALHETSHFVADVYGLNEKTFATLVSTSPNVRKIALISEWNPSGNPGLRINISERIADGAAALYLLSNYKDGKSFLQDAKDVRTLNLEATHYTTTTLDLAILEYKKSGKPGLSIVEATKWAAGIVENQINIGTEYDTVFQADAKVTYGDVSELHDDQLKAFQQARVSRRNFFRLSGQ